MDADNANSDLAHTGRPLDPSLRLEAVPYEPDGGCPLFGLLLVFAVCFGSGVGLGWVCSWFKQWFYIIILVPGLVGVVLGIVGAIPVVIGKVRNGFVAAVAGLFAGFVAMGAMHYFDYQRFLSKLQEAQQVRNGVVVLVNPVIDGIPVKAGESPGLFEHIDRKAAAQGVPIHLRRLNFNLGHVGAYIYWIIEILIAGGLTALILYSVATEPFCLACGSWKDKRVLGKLNLATETVEDIFTRGEIVRLADLDVRSDKGHIHVTVWVCPQCGAEAPVDVKIEDATKVKDEEMTKQVAYVTYPGQALPILESLFEVETTPATGARQPPDESEEAE
jgi:hypothetical protein